MTKLISILLRKSLAEGKLPFTWKVANITPIHKKGPKHQVNNYRPISLTSIHCEILERLIRKELMDQMESNNLFTKHQHGFRKGHSCVTQLIEIIDDWTNELDKFSVDTIYLDFQKAFDTVFHKIERLWNIRIIVELSRTFSYWTETKSGAERREVTVVTSNERYTTG